MSQVNVTNQKTLPWHMGALALYAAAALIFIDHGLNPQRVILGAGEDPSAFMWFLAWWPYALGHHLNPFYTHFVWQPGGVNIAWTSSTPVLGLLVWPVTALGGALLAYNLLTLAAPVLAAIGAYALCLYVTRQPPAAMLGGYLFGFSTYELAQSIGHLNLAFTLFVPLLLLVVLARLDGALERHTACGAAAVLLTCQFGVSVEVFATSLFFGALAWLLALVCFPARRPALGRLVLDGLYAAPLLLIFISPSLWAMFELPHQFSVSPAWPSEFSTDLLNLLVPTVTTKLGGALAAPLTRHFTGFPAEQDGYFGFLLLGLLAAFCRRHSAFFGVLLGIIILLSLGPVLHVAGIATGLPLPWALGEKLPLLGAALPARFVLYAWLLAAIMIALWVAEPPAGPVRSRRMLLSRLACLLLLPSIYAGQPDPALHFFAPGRVTAVLGPHPRLLILPFGVAGDSTFWQMQSNFSFAQTGGYLGSEDGYLQGDLAMMRLYDGLPAPGLTADFAAFCRHSGTDYVVATPGTPADVLADVESLDWPARRVDEVTVFTVPHG